MTTATSSFRQYKIDSRRFGLYMVVPGAIAMTLYYGDSDFNIKEMMMHNLFFVNTAVAEDSDTVSEFPSYSLKEVSEHNSLESGVWVTYKDNVYDVTNFVKNHPGGDSKIMMAAGGAVDPFWSLYQGHKADSVQNLLDTFFIGKLEQTAETKAKQSSDNEFDPYATEPSRHPILTVNNEKPFNAEPPAVLLPESFLTPNEIFYIRNHLPVPQMDDEEFELTIEIENVKKSQDDSSEDDYEYNTLKTFSFDDLVQSMNPHDVVMTLQCAGNRRKEMDAERPVNGLQWGHAAIGNAKWTGTRLRDVLLNNIPKEKLAQAKHVHFEGADTDAFNEPYAASIPIETALSEEADVILAYKMNDEPLPRDHGAPLRAIVPGHVGARNVKWVNRIVLSEEESRSHWQREDYKLLTPFIDWSKTSKSEAPSIQELPVQSAICIPEPGSDVNMSGMESGELLKIAGYAVSGGGRGIIRVDVSVDDGKSWTQAVINRDGAELNPKQNWAWTLWSVIVPVPADISGDMKIICKAVDTSCNQQPENIKSLWNIRGLVCNSWNSSMVKIVR